MVIDHPFRPKPQMQAPPLARQNSGLSRRKLAYPRLKYCSIGINKDGAGSTGGGGGGGSSSDTLDLNALQALLESKPPSYNFREEKRALERVESERAEMVVFMDDVKNREEEKKRQREDTKRKEKEAQEEKERMAEEMKRTLEANMKQAKQQKLTSLTAQQKEVMASFEAVTGASGGPDTMELLELNNWDLNRGIATYFDNGMSIESALKVSRKSSGGGAQPRAVSNDATVTIVYPDSSETTATFSKSDTLWMVYQHIQSSGKIHPVGRTLRLTAINPRTDDMNVYDDSQFDKQVDHAGLFPTGQVRVAYPY